MAKEIKHSDGTTCFEGTQMIPEDYHPCCSAFAQHTSMCDSDVRYEFWKEHDRWYIPISPMAGGGGIEIDFCPHCGRRLSPENPQKDALQRNIRTLTNNLKSLVHQRKVAKEIGREDIVRISDEMIKSTKKMIKRTDEIIA
jgi:hypothetical protein